jgi:hypothetical protein
MNVCNKRSRKKRNENANDRTITTIPIMHPPRVDEEYGVEDRGGIVGRVWEVERIMVILVKGVRKVVVVAMKEDVVVVRMVDEVVEEGKDVVVEGMNVVVAVMNEGVDEEVEVAVLVVIEVVDAVVVEDNGMHPKDQHLPVNI